jgi:hypothetical protein
VLPKGFVRIRYFGVAPRCRTYAPAQCRQAPAVDDARFGRRPGGRETVGHVACPRCGAPMRVVERLTARQYA